VTDSGALTGDINGEPPLDVAEDGWLLRYDTLAALLDEVLILVPEFPSFKKVKSFITTGKNGITGEREDA
jgi:hypothetical protein